MTTTAATIGRYQIPHRAHHALIRHSLGVADHVLVILGSAFCARSPVNPFTVQERQEMIFAGLDPADRSRVSFAGARDRYNEALWVSDITRLVESHRQSVHADGPTFIVGHMKDHTSEYLNWFPTYLQCLDAPVVHGLSSSNIRASLFSRSPNALFEAHVLDAVHPDVLPWLRHWLQTPEGAFVSEYHLAVEAYKRKWGPGPHYTGDALIRCNGHVLLVRRGGDIGAGQLALPGGFREPGESGVEAALRELDEETSLLSLGLPLQTLLDAFKGSTEFGHLNRSPRGHIFTETAFFDLPNMPELPLVKARHDSPDGVCDASEALWAPETSLPSLEDHFFEDHSNMVFTTLGITPTMSFYSPTYRIPSSIATV